VRFGLNVAKAFIPLDPEVGREAEVDWGTAMAIIAGKPTTVKFFGMRSRYSAKHFVRGYPCERQQAFFDAHLHAFRFFNGVFPALVYDNLTSAVKQVYEAEAGWSRPSLPSSTLTIILRPASVIRRRPTKKAASRAWWVMCGIALLTPEMVHYGKAPAVIAGRQEVLDAAYAAHPECFVRKLPVALPLPEAAWINPPQKEALTE
jgi:hypothetical protein